MIINSINVNNAFGAKVSCALKEEMIQKGIKLRRKTSKNRPVRIPQYFRFLNEIKQVLPNAIVSIDKDNSSQYNVLYNNKTYYIPRKKDGEFYQYKSLRTGLKDLEQQLKNNDNHI